RPLHPGQDEQLLLARQFLLHRNQQRIVVRNSRIHRNRSGSPMPRISDMGFRRANTAYGSQNKSRNHVSHHTKFQSRELVHYRPPFAESTPAPVGRHGTTDSISVPLRSPVENIPANTSKNTPT